MIREEKGFRRGQALTLPFPDSFYGEDTALELFASSVLKNKCERSQLDGLYKGGYNAIQPNDNK